MSAYDGKFIRKPSVANLPIIHEEASQDIQGGTAGEHYHLTAAQLALLDTIGSSGSSLEPAMIAHDILTTVDGDIVMMSGGS